MEENRIQKITKDIEHYRAAISDLEGAMQEAERELDEELRKEYEGQENG